MTPTLEDSNTCQVCEAFNNYLKLDYRVLCFQCANNRIENLKSQRDELLDAMSKIVSYDQEAKMRSQGLKGYDDERQSHFNNAYAKIMSIVYTGGEMVERSPTPSGGAERGGEG